MFRPFFIDIICLGGLALENGVILTREQARALGEELYIWIDAAMGALSDYGLDESILRKIMKKIRYEIKNIKLIDEEASELSKVLDEYIVMHKIDVIMEIKKNLDSIRESTNS
jgi:hypothetical protein